MISYEPYDYGVRIAKVPIQLWDRTGHQEHRGPSNRHLKKKRGNIIRFMIFLMCLAGCAYQTCTFLIIYFSYPTSMNIDVGHNSEMQPPGVTVCNANRFRRAAFCSMFPAKCHHPSNASEYCKEYPIFCEEGQSDFLIPLPESGKYYEYNCNRTLNVKLGHLSDPLIKRVEWLVTDNTKVVHKENYTNVPMSEGVTCPRNCYLVNSLINDPNGYLPKISLKTDERKIMKIFLDLEPEEYFDPLISVEALVDVHTPFAIHNPYIHGFIAKPGYIYYVDITMTEENTLPPPYTTMCYDYFKHWKKGEPLNWEMCIRHCKMHKARDKCNCVPSRISYPHEERFCTKEEMKCVENANVLKCYEECKQQCYARHFKYTVASKEIPEDLIHFYEYIWGNTSHEMRDRCVIMIFMLSDPQALVYSYHPKYETIELYSYLGGYTGIWLGISLFTIFDFIQEKLLRLCSKFSRNRRRIVSVHRSDIFNSKRSFCKCSHFQPRIVQHERITYLP